MTGMRPSLIACGIALFLIPASAQAYRVPERDTWRALTLSLLNESRTEAHLSPLGLDADLMDIAQAHAEDSAVHFDDASAATRRATYIIHTSSDRRTLRERVLGRDLHGGVRFGENVGFRYSSRFGDDLFAKIEEAIRIMHSAMMAEVPPDDGHKQTILGDYTHVGIGLELHRAANTEMNTLFLVQDFGEFTDGRSVVIPEVPAIPKSTPPSRVQPEIPPQKAVPALSRRTRTRVPRSAVKSRRLPVPSSPRLLPPRSQYRNL